jgi:dTDP-4-dehydrorhamnose 3,5-epimerase
MKFEVTELEGVVLCKPNVYKDERGYFSEVFKKEELNKFLNLDIEFVQDNEAKSVFGVLRGLHYQVGGNSQSKLLRVIEGEILDVVLDVRKGSPTFGKSVSVILNDQNKNSIFVPRGFAHGYVVLSEKAIVNYKVDNIYSPKDERGVCFNDEDLAIDWKLKKNDLILSDKDKIYPLLKNADCFDFKVNLYA